MNRHWKTQRRKARAQALLEQLEGYVLFSASPVNVVLMDRSLGNYAMLRRAVSAEAVVIEFNHRETAASVLERAAQAAAGRNALIGSLTVLSHGSPGQFQLGGEFVSAANLSVTLDAWHDLGTHFAAGGRIYVYGCRVVEEGSGGQGLLDALAKTTGAAVYGSENITGAGGDWKLEAASRGAAALDTAAIPLDFATLDEYRGQLVWIGATSGTTNNNAHDYNNTANWAGGVIDDSFAGVTFTGNTTIYFSANRTTGAAGLNLGYLGNFDLLFQSDKNPARTLTLGGNITGDLGGANGRTVTFGNAGNSQINVTLSASRVFNLAGAGDKIVFINALSDGGNGYGITISGNGTTLINSAATYRGATIINTGATLQIGDGTTSAALGNAMDAANATAVTVNGSLVFDLGTTYTGPTYTSLSGSGTVALLSSGTAYSIKMDGTNSSFTGNVTIEGGCRLQLDNAYSYFASGSNATVEDGGALFIVAAGNWTGHVNITGIGWSGDGHGYGAIRLGNAINVTGAITLTGNAIINQTGGVVNSAIMGNVSDGGNGYSLTLATQGILTLAGVNTFTGGLVVAGNVMLGSATALAANNDVTIGSATSIGSLAADANGRFSLNGYSVTIDALTIGGAGTNNMMVNDGATAATLTLGGGNANFTYSGLIADGSTGALALIKTGTGTATLTKGNTFTGNTTISAGAIQLGNATALSTGTITVNATSGLTFGTGITTVSLGGLAGSGTILLRDAASTAVALTIGSNNFSNTFSGALSGNGTVTKTGSGTQIFSGASTYTGNTSVSAGTLLANNASGSATGTGAVAVANGATVGGTGAVSGAVTAASGGTISPGNASTAILSTGNLAMPAGATYTFSMNGSTAGTNYDQVNVTGTVNLTGSTLSLSSTRTLHGGDQIILISNDGSDAVTGTFSGLAEGATLVANGVRYVISYQGGTGNDVVLTDAAPSVVTPANATPSPVTGTTTTLSVLGGSAAGESGLTYTWSLTAQPASSSPLFSANGTNGSKSTTVTFDKAGSYTFQVTISDGTNSVTSSVSVTVNQTLTTITVSPSSATVSQAGTQQFTAAGYDQFGAAMSSQPTFTWSKAAGVGSINSSGLYTAPSSAGSATIQATSGSITGSATVTVSNAAPTIATPANATPSPVTGTTTGLSALGADDGGEANLIYTWSLTAQPASSNPLFSVNGTNGAKNTTVTFNKAGSYTFQVTVSDGSLTVTSSVTVTVSQTLTTITVSPSSATMNENATQQFTATAFDQFGNAMSSQPSFTWSKASGIGSIDASGLYSSPGAAGPATVRATSGSVFGAATITVNNAAPTITTPAFANPSPATGTTTVLHVLGADDGGEVNLTYTWALTAQPASSNPIFPVNGTNGAKDTTVTFDKAGSYTFQVTVSDGTNTTTSSVTVSVSQTLTSITVSPGSPTLAPNGTQQFSATGYDQFGNAMSSQPSFTWSKSSGVGSINASGLYTAPGTSGAAVIQAASGSITATASVTVTNAAPTIATPANATPSPVTGTTTGLTVLGADDAGESGLTYTWSATSKPVGTNPLFSINGTNAAKSTTVTFDAAGSYTFLVTVSDGSLTVTSSVSVTVDQTLTSITVTPGTSSIGTNSTKQFTATGFDQFGDAMAVQPAFTWTLDGGSVGSVDSAGLFTSDGSTGSATVRATSGALSNTAGVTVTSGNTAPTIVTPANATPSPVTGTTTDLSVLGTDDAGEPALTYTWSVTAKPSGSGPLLSVNGNNGAKNTTVTFDKAGNYTFLVTISDGTFTVTDSVTVTVSQTLTSIAISPGSASLNQNGTRQFTAIAYDQFSQAMATQPAFMWSVTSGIGSMNGSGLYTAPGGVGSATVEVSSGAVNDSATVTVSNAAPTVASPAFASPNPSTGTTSVLHVLGDDDAGEAGLTYTWSLTAQPASSSVIYSVNGTNGAKDTTATFDKAGSYTFQVVISDGTLSTTSTVTVTVSQTLTSITVAPAGGAINLNQTQQFTATGLDQFGDTMSSQPSFTWSVASGAGSINSSGLYTPGATAGSITIRATSGSTNGSTVLTVNNAAPTVATPADATPGTVTGLTTVLTVLGADDQGETNLTYTWSLTAKPALSGPLFSVNGTNGAKSTTVTFDQAGNYTFLVTISDGTNSVTSSVSVTVSETLTSIVVSPSSVTMNEMGTQQFTAVAYDQFGDAMSVQPAFTWSKTAGIGGINASGLYTAPGAAGSATVRATSGGVFGAATITVNNAAPTIATPAFASPNPSTGTTSVLHVLGDDDAGETGLTYTWALTSQPASSSVIYSVNGTNGAKDTTATFNRAGSYTFQVTVSDGTNTTTSSVVVVVDQTLTAISVTPGTGGINLSQTQQFSATGLDQFGRAMTVQPAFTWSLAAGTGSVDGTGLYTPGAAGTMTVQAASGSTTGTAVVTVSNAAPALVTPAHATPGTVTGLTTDLSALASDDGGAGNLVYTWALTSQPASSGPVFLVNGNNAAKNTTVTFDKAGVYQFRVTISDGTNAITSSVMVTVSQTLTSMSVVPASPTLAAGHTQQFTATGYDQFGNAMAAQPAFVWSLIAGTGAVNGSGLYTAPLTAATATVRAAFGGFSDTASITVTNTSPVIGAGPSATPSPVTGTTALLHVLASDDGGESNLVYTWTTTAKPAGAGPVFAINGSNAAKDTIVTFAQAGAYTFQVVVSDGTTTDTASFTVNVNQTLSVIQISPGTAILDRDQTQQFSAVALDQFGIAMAAQPAISWTTTENNIITAGGLFTAKSTSGFAIVTANAGAVSSSVTLTLTQSAPVVPPVDPLPPEPPVVVPTGPTTPVIPPPPPPPPSGPSTPTTPSTPPPHTPSQGNGGLSGGDTTPSNPGPEQHSDGKQDPNPGPKPPSPGPANPVSNPPTPTVTNNGNNGTNGNPVLTVKPGASFARGTMTPANLAQAGNPELRSGPRKSLKELMSAAETQPSAMAAIAAPLPAEVEEQLAETEEKINASQMSVKRVVGTIATMSAGISAGYVLWLVRGGSLLLSMLSSVPIWRFMDPLPVLNQFKPRRKRWWSKKEEPPSDKPDATEERLERLID